MPLPYGPFCCQSVIRHELIFLHIEEFYRTFHIITIICTRTVPWHYIALSASASSECEKFETWMPWLGT